MVEISVFFKMEENDHFYIFKAITIIIMPSQFLQDYSFMKTCKAR